MIRKKQKRTQFDKEKAEGRAHILEGLLIALDHIDEVIRTIRDSETDAIAQAELMRKFELSERQSQAILDMRLRRFYPRYASSSFDRLRT